MNPVGVNEIAELLCVKPKTVHQWRTRGIFPPPDGTVSGTPWWEREVVEEWAVETGRDSRS